MGEAEIRIGRTCEDNMFKITCGGIIFLFFPPLFRIQVFACYCVLILCRKISVFYFFLVNKASIFLEILFLVNAGHVARMEEGRSAFKILTGKPPGKRLLGRPRRRWKDNIRMDLEEIGINAGNWVDSAQDRNYWRALVNAALNLRVP